MEQKQFSPTDSHFKHSSFQHSPSTPAASLSLQPIAYIHSDFSEKFGIPRQSGLVNSLQAKIVFTEPFRNQDCIRGIEEFSHGLFGGFPKISVTSGHQPSARQDSAEIKEKEYLPVVRLSAQTLLDYPLYAQKNVSPLLRKDHCSIFPVQIYQTVLQSTTSNHILLLPIPIRKLPEAFPQKLQSTVLSSTVLKDYCTLSPQKKDSLSQTAFPLTHDLPTSMIQNESTA